MKKRYLFNLIAALLLFSAYGTVKAAEAPYLPPINDQTAMLNELFTIDVDAVNANPQESYQLVESRPGMYINSTTGEILWTPRDESDGGKVTVRAFNSVGESIRSFYVYLADEIVCNSDLHSYWKLDETSGPTYADYAGGNTATTLTAVRDTTGMVSRGKVFTPSGITDQFMYVPDEGQYDFNRTEGFSISMWINYKGQHTNNPVNQVLMARGNPSTTYPVVCMILMVDASLNKVSWQIRPNSTETIRGVVSSTTLVVGQWYHVVATYDGISNTFNLWVNNSKASGTHTYGNNNFTGGGKFDLNIGYWSMYASNTFPFNGAMDEVLIYKRAMTDAEVSEAYTDGTNGLGHCKPNDFFPIVKSTAIDTVSEESQYSYFFEAGDYYNEPLTLAADIYPGFLQFNSSTGELFGTPADSDVGQHTVKLRASDASTTVYQEFVLTVSNVNDMPEITSTPPTQILEGGTYTYIVVANDPDGDPLTYTQEIIPSWLNFDPNSHALVGIPSRENVGDNPVKINISDGVFTVVHEFNIEVTSNNKVPIVTSTPPPTVNNYTDYQYQMTAYDGDGDALTYGVTTVPPWLSFDPATQILSGRPEAIHVGMHTVILTVSDGYAPVDHEFTITVLQVNTPPEVLNEANDTAKIDQLYTYLMTVVDYQNDPIVVTPTVIPPWLNFDVASRVLSGTPAQENLGLHNVIITISDGLYTVNEQFTINVVPKWPIGIEESEKLVVAVYPSPASDVVFIELNGQPTEIQIADISGKVVVNRKVEQGENKIQINVSELSSGLYFVRVLEDSRYDTRKLIIE